MNMNKNSRLMYTQDFIFDILSTMYFCACAYQCAYFFIDVNTGYKIYYI